MQINNQTAEQRKRELIALEMYTHYNEVLDQGNLDPISEGELTRLRDHYQDMWLRATATKPFFLVG